MKKISLLSIALLCIGTLLQCTPKPPPVAYADLEWKDDVYFMDGKPYSGMATAEYSVGHPKGEYPFLDGKMHGLVREWWENGQPSVETNFDKGQRHGSNKYWRKDGSLMKEQIYDHDQAVKTIHFDEHGNAHEDEAPKPSAPSS